VAQEFVVAAEVVLGLQEASPPSADVASLEILAAAPFQAVAVAWDLAGFAAMAEYPFRAAESVWAASDPAAAVGCCQPSTASTAECWVAWRKSQAVVVVAASRPVVVAY
jgi:hypothetical protein